jgi:hypothetical protein
MKKNLLFKELYLSLSNKTIRISYMIIIILFIIIIVVCNNNYNLLLETFDKSKMNNDLLLEGSNKFKNFYFIDQNLIIQKVPLTIIWKPFRRGIPKVANEFINILLELRKQKRCILVDRS